MTETLLVEDLAATSDMELPVMDLSDLRVLHIPASGDRAPRIDVVHSDRPGSPLISLDPTDAATLTSRLAEQIAAAWVHADAGRQRSDGAP
jgi:hypothetical protein